jgi:NTE family protein
MVHPQALRQAAGDRIGNWREGFGGVGRDCPLANNVVKPTQGADLHRPPFTEMAVLTDGGVYDNLGLERVWKRCRTILVSNAGKNTPDIGSPTGRWVGQLFRTLNLVQQQAENSRKRILFGISNMGQRRVAFWSIDTPSSAYGLADALDLSPEEAARAANLRTRLNSFSAAEIDLLLRAGYAGADASLRKRGIVKNDPAASFAGVVRNSSPRRC